jgi:hypothetical protein
VGDFTNSTQVHDWEPGIEPSGLFWTIPISDDLIAVKPGSGRARFRARDLAVPDFTSFANAIALNPTTDPSHVSFDCRWAGGGKRTTIHDTTYGFEGTFVDGPASMKFVARRDDTGVTYRSDPEDQITVAAAVGHERNGVFFH